jgi:SAM-dependent methyltransferase
MEQKQGNELIVISVPSEVNMGDEWFEIAPIDHFWIKWRFQAILKNISPAELSDKRFLEIGCGHGLVIQQFESLHNVIVDGCDLNINALHMVKRGKGNIYFLNIFDQPEHLLRCYSGVILLDVLEHIEDDAGFLSASCKYLNDNGFVIINVPALNSLYSKYDKKMGHIRRYSKKMILKLFEKNNIQPLSIHFWGFSLLPVLILRKILLLFIEDKSIVNVGFKTSGKMVNKAFTLLMKTENVILKNPPLGTSLIAIGKYTAKK